MLQQRWRNKYSGIRVPPRPRVCNMKNNFVIHGTVVNNNKNCSGRPWAGRLPSNIAAVQRDLRQQSKQ